MRQCALKATILTVLLGVLLLPGAYAYQYPSSPERAVQDFLFLRNQLKASVDPSPVALAGQIASLSGQVLDLAGEMVASTSTQSEGNRSFSYLLQTLAGVTVMVTSPEELAGLEVGEQVRMLVEVPQNACGLDPMQFRGAVRISDLPLDQRPGASAPLQQTPATEQPVPQDNGQQADLIQSTPEFNAADLPSPAAPLAQRQIPARPGSEPADTSGNHSGASMSTIQSGIPAGWMAQSDVERWKRWVGAHNRSLSDQQAELIVRSMIHYARMYGIDHRLCFAVGEAESSFQPGSNSSTGAMGIMQLMPGTAAGLGVKDPWNVSENIRGGIKYLAGQISSFGSKSNYQQTCLGLAAYNAGPGAVRRYGGVPPITETINYVKKVTGRFYQLWKDGYP